MYHINQYYINLYAYHALFNYFLIGSINICVAILNNHKLNSFVTLQH